jgi:translation elongation factor EF-G
MTSKIKTDKDTYKLLMRAVESCDNSEDAPVVAFVSKMVSIPKASFNERGLSELVGTTKDRTLGFARVYSGRLKRGQTVYVIGPKPKKIDIDGQIEYEWDVQSVQVDNLYILMAQHPEGVK